MVRRNGRSRARVAVETYPTCRVLNHHWTMDGKVTVDGRTYRFESFCPNCTGRRSSFIDRRGRLIKHTYEMPEDYSAGQRLSKANARVMILLEG